MSGEKNIESPELIAPATVSDSPLNLSEKDMGKEGNQSDSVSSVPATADATSVAKAADQPTSYEYYYPGYNGTYTDDKGYYNAAGGSYTGNNISDSNSPLYYYTGYGSYTTGYASTEYLQQPCSYGSDSFPCCYSSDSTYSGDVSNGTAAQSGSSKPVMGPSGPGKSDGNSSSFSSKTVSSPFNSKAQHQTSNFSKPDDQNQHVKPKFTFRSRQPGFYARSSPITYQPNAARSSYNNNDQHSNYQQPGFYARSSPVTYQPNAARSSYNNNDQHSNYQTNNYRNNNYQNKSREMPVKNSEPEALTELTRGPRFNRSTSSKEATEAERAGLSINTSSINSKEFQIEYKDAKFFVIKSYSEDDVHKCLKYAVWSSTPNGNRKLDAAYHEAEAKTSETGGENICPIFLFFSVNASGQFVGVAEMIGKVDFSKDMDFWQLNKWNGFFPLMWHIVKDVPNALLRHIILENNENKPVTFTRDTQEIGLKQGLEMLNIFKNYSEKTCLLDDFKFYENREKSFKVKRNAKPASHFDSSTNIGYKKHFEVGKSMAREQPARTGQSDPSTLISLTRNLSLNSK